MRWTGWRPVWPRPVPAICTWSFTPSPGGISPPQRTRRGAGLLAEAGARATPDAPLARLAMEADAAPGSAAVTLTVWPGGTPILTARAGFHGQHIHWLA
ncbi:MAG: DUF2332 family protein [Rhodobacter sp.]|nr:DUF2332 family protein [Rhodobacter sp.]